MEGKKISFGFMKTKKAEKPVLEEKRDYIECVEEKSIKVVGGETEIEVAPLVIPMKPNTLVTAERLKEIAAKVENSLLEPEIEKSNDVKTNIEIKPAENETLDQMAVRELLQESTKEIKVDEAVLTVPIPSKPVIEGQKESTLEDYDSIPIQDFGMAMLRGMGWTPGKDQSKFKQPQLRPKGLGLGADKVISENQKKKSNKDSKEEELSIIKNSYVKITTGKHNGYYGKVISLDEDTGRVTVDITVKKETVSLSEFMMQPVPKAEFDKESKVINTDAFDNYKKNENSHTTKSSRNESPQSKDRSNNGSQKNSDKKASSSQKSNDTRKDYRKDESSKKDYEISSSRSRDSDKHDRSRRNSSSSEDRSKRKKDKPKRDSSSSEDRTSKKRKEKEKIRYSSNESLSSVSDSERKKKKNHRRRKDSSESEVEKHKKDKRDIDKKRKGKKKKRDRDRSPNYKKHRK